MARRKKREGSSTSLSILPSKIELIDASNGNVKEFNTDHAQRILALQTKMGMGSYKLYNTELYTYDEGSRTIKQNIKPEPSEGDSFIEPS